MRAQVDAISHGASFSLFNSNPLTRRVDNQSPEPSNTTTTGINPTSHFNLACLFVLLDPYLVLSCLGNVTSLNVEERPKVSDHWTKVFFFIFVCYYSFLNHLSSHFFYVTLLFCVYKRLKSLVVRHRLQLICTPKQQHLNVYLSLSVAKLTL